MSDSSHSTGAYRVVVFARPDDQDEFVGAVIEATGTNRVDARIAWNLVPGILPHKYSLDVASELANSIRGLGVNASVVLGSALPHLDRAETVHRCACEPEGLEIAGLSGARSALIEWQNIVLVSVGLVPLETAKHYNVEPQVAVFSAPHSHTELTETTAITGFELWLIAAHPDRIFRIEQDRMNYEYLAERKVPSAAANFKVFLTDIALHAKHAYLTPAAHALIEFQPVGKYRFTDSAALQRETLMHFLLHREQQRVLAPKAE